MTHDHTDPDTNPTPARTANARQAPRTANKPLSRRDFLNATAAVSAGVFVAGCQGPMRRGAKVEPIAALRYARGSEQPLRVGLIGCGGRGHGAAIDCLNAAPNVRIVALGDLFQDRLDGCRKGLSENAQPQQIDDDRCFVGFDAYQRVIDSGVDMVILAAPPHFRPPHLRAAVDAGKHVFMEKPVAVDPVGVRSVIASSEEAQRRGLSIVAGTQRRHAPNYIEVMRRVHDGAIGEIVGGQCYWNQGLLWVKQREPGWTDMEWQCRNWLYFTWLSGDHIVEQHIHNLDIINWAMGGPPVKAVGMGGRQVRTGAECGDIFDHFAVEYEYANGARVLSMCRQIGGCSDRVSERLVGTKGVAIPSGEITGPHAYKFEYEGEAVNPYVQEHVNLIEAIRSGRPVNEGRRVAESTMTAIMGRMSAYTGREVSWNWVMNASKLDLTPPAYAFGDLPVGPVAVPGQTPLV